MLKKNLYQIRFALIPIIIYLVLMQFFFGTVCPIKAFLHVDCPGCGLTHAVIYLFMGRLNDSVSANPTAILWLISIMLFIIDRYIYKLKIKPFPYLFIITGLITILWYFIKKIPM